MAGKDGGGYDVFDGFLDKAAHGASTHFGVIALVDENLFSFWSEDDGNFLWFESAVGGGDDQIENLQQIVFAERLKQTNFVEAIQEFGFEFVAGDQVFDKSFFEIGDLFAGGDFFTNGVGASVGGGDDDAVAEGNFAVFGVAQDAFVKNLEQGGQN